MASKQIVCLFFTVLLWAASGCQTFKARDAVKVNDAVIVQHKALVTSFEQLMKTLEARDKASIPTALEDMRKAADAGLETVAALTPPPCHQKFLPEAEALFRFYSRSAQEEYAAIARYCTADSITYAGFDSLQMILAEVEAAQKLADQQFLDAQQAFAGNCGFKLVRNVE